MADFHRHVSVAVSVAASVSLAVSVAVSVTVSVKTVSVPAVMPLLLGRVRGNSAAGLGGRAPSFPRKRVGGAPGAYERQIRKNRTRSYMNGWTATANLRKRRTLFFYVSNGVLTEFLRMNVLLTYFATETDTATDMVTDTWRWKSAIRRTHAKRVQRWIDISCEDTLTVFVTETHLLTDTENAPFPKRAHLVAVEVVLGEQLVVAVFLERDDDESDEDVEEEEWKHDEVDDVEDGRVSVRFRLRTSLFHCRVHRRSQQPTPQRDAPLFYGVTPSLKVSRYQESSLNRIKYRQSG